MYFLSTSSGHVRTSELLSSLMIEQSTTVQHDMTELRQRFEVMMSDMKQLVNKVSKQYEEVDKQLKEANKKLEELRKYSNFPFSELIKKFSRLSVFP